MKGIDEKLHFYKSLERACCVKQEKITDKDNLSAEEMAYLQYRNAQPAFLYA